MNAPAKKLQMPRVDYENEPLGFKGSSKALGKITQSGAFEQFPEWINSGGTIQSTGNRAYHSKNGL